MGLMINTYPDAAAENDSKLVTSSISGKMAGQAVGGGGMRHPDSGRLAQLWPAQYLNLTRQFGGHQPSPQVKARAHPAFLIAHAAVAIVKIDSSRLDAETHTKNLETMIHLVQPLNGGSGTTNGVWAVRRAECSLMPCRRP